MVASEKTKRGWQVVEGQWAGKVATLTILDAESLSDEISLEGHRFIAFEMPAAWTASDLIIWASSGGTYKKLYGDDGVLVRIKVDADRIVGLDTGALKVVPLRSIKLESVDGAGNPVVQDDDREIKLIVKG